MKNNNNIILLSAAALLLIGLGLGAGYLLFGKDTKTMEAAPEHEHTTGEEEQIWTCSMHPQIRQNEPGKCPICEMELVPLKESSGDNPLVLEMTREAAKLAQVQTTVVGATGMAVKNVSFSGKIEEDERLASSQAAHVPGRIEKLFVTFTGEQVRKGQNLASIYSPELISAQQELLEALQFQDVNPELVKAARKKLKNWKITEEQIRIIEESQQLQETFTVLADDSGVVTKREVSVGDYVQQGEVLFELANLNRVWVLFDAYEEDLAAIQVGDRISFTTPAMPNRMFTTRITFIDPVIDPETRTASLRGEVRNPNGLLKPQMLVRGKLDANIKACKQLLVPKSAVLWTGERSVVYVKLANRKIPSFKFREVKLGESTGGSYLVESGLEAGEEVVTHGNFAIDAAAQLNNQASMINRDVLLEGTDASSDLPDYRESTPEAFQQQLQEALQAYLQLKDALVATDEQQAQEQARQLLTMLTEIDMSLLKGEPHHYWMEQLEALEAHSRQISQAGEVEEQRKQFDFLSQAMITTLKIFGVQKNIYYVQHCPMAFDDDGADWISDEEAIRNPYFGEQMLKCGVVEDTIGR